MDEKTKKAIRTFIQCVVAYLIVMLLGYTTIKLFDIPEINALVTGLIGSILSLVMSFIDDKLDKWEQDKH